MTLDFSGQYEIMNDHLSTYATLSTGSLTEVRESYLSPLMTYQLVQGM